MIRLHVGSGAADLELGGSFVQAFEWRSLRATAVRLLEKRGQKSAVGLLHKLPFELRHGTNGFGDEFVVLVACVSVDRYAEIGEQSDKPVVHAAARTLATTVEEIRPDINVRHVIVMLDTEEMAEAVRPPVLAFSSVAVESALRDAEVLMGKNGPSSAVDRVHTALHGYLKVLCAEAKIPCVEDESVTGLFKKLRTQHPTLKDDVGLEQVGSVLKGMASGIDALNMVRNNFSGAHPKGRLDSAEAMLMINFTRSVLHYLKTKLD